MPLASSRCIGYWNHRFFGSKRGNSRSVPSTRQAVSAAADLRAASTPSRKCRCQPAPSAMGRHADIRRSPSARSSSLTRARQSPKAASLASIHDSTHMRSASDSSLLRSSSETCSSIMSSRASGSRAKTPDPLARSMERFCPWLPLLWWWQYTTAQPRLSATLSNWLQKAAIWSALFSSPVMTL